MTSGTFLPSSGWLAEVLSLAVANYVTGSLSLLLANPPGTAPTFWPPAGIALAGMLLFDYGVWPGVWLGAFLVFAAPFGERGSETALQSLAVAAGVGLGDVLQALAGAWLVFRLLGKAPALGSLREVLVLTILAGLAGSTVRATVGAAVAAASAVEPFWDAWWAAWRADVVGVLVFAPLLLTVANARRQPGTALRPIRVVEAAVLFVGFAIGSLVLTGKEPTFPGAFFVVIFLLWAALRFGTLGNALGMLVIALLMAWNVNQGDAVLGTIKTSDDSRVLTAQTLLSVLGMIFWVLVATQSDRQRALRELRDNEARYRSLVELAPDAVMILEEGRIAYCNPAGLSLLGAPSPEALLGKPVRDFLHPDDHAASAARIRTVRQTGRPVPPHHFRARRLDGQPIDVESRAGPCVHRGEEAVQVVSRDITERKRAEERLRASLLEKEALLKEVHHRVKNNLQIISSLLNLQSAQLNDPAALAVFTESQNRVRAMALVHEALYHAENLAHIDLARYLEGLCAQLFRAYGPDPARVRLDVCVADSTLDLDRAVPCGLVVNELVSNSLKYAFPGGRRGRVAVELAAPPGGAYALSVSDDGVGLPDGLDFRHTRTLGLELVCGLTRQLGGTIELDQTGGTRFTITFASHSEGNSRAIVPVPAGATMSSPHGAGGSQP
jgi:PAS domain S-box-containing protein